MPDQVGTRSRQTLSRNHPDQGNETRTHQQDPGMSKLASASMTFTGSTARVAAANGTFAAFVLNDTVLFSKTNLNNGQHVVIGLDAINQAYLTLDPPPKDEGPIAATVRTY